MAREAAVGHTPPGALCTGDLRLTKRCIMFRRDPAVRHLTGPLSDTPVAADKLIARAEGDKYCSRCPVRLSPRSAIVRPLAKGHEHGDPPGDQVLARFIAAARRRRHAGVLGHR